MFFIIPVTYKNFINLKTILTKEWKTKFLYSRKKSNNYKPNSVKEPEIIFITSKNHHLNLSIPQQNNKKYKRNKLIPHKNHNNINKWKATIYQIFSMLNCLSYYKIIIMKIKGLKRIKYQIYKSKLIYVHLIYKLHWILILNNKIKNIIKKSKVYLLK